MIYIFFYTLITLNVLWHCLLKKLKKKILKICNTSADFKQSIISTLESELISQGVNAFVLNEILDKVKQKLSTYIFNNTNSKNTAFIIIKAALESVLYFLFGTKKNYIIIDDYIRNDILILGSHGVGKTLMCVKIGNKFADLGYNVCVATIDNKRNGAQNQLKALIENTSLHIIEVENSKEMSSKEILAEIYKKCPVCNILVIDSFGISSDKETHILELKESISDGSFVEKIIVCDSMYGHSSEKFIKYVTKNIAITGLVFTKFDASINCGSVINARAISLKPIYYISDGEGIYDIYTFEANFFISKILMDMEISSFNSFYDANNEITTFDDLIKYFKNIPNSENIIYIIKKMSKMMTQYELHKILSLSHERKKEISDSLKISTQVIDKLIMLFQTLIDKKTDTIVENESFTIHKLLYEDLIVYDFKL